MTKRLFGIVSLVIVLALLAACGGAATPAPQAPAEKEEAPAQEAPAEKEEAPAEQPAAEEKMEEPFKVAFVYVAPIGDLGWTWAHDQGRLMIEEEFGDKVETAFIENVPEGPEAERVIRDFAQKGFDLIFTTSFGFMDPTITVAQEFPETWFVHISGYKTAPNVSTVFGRMYQPRYLSGLAAGAATKSNIIGYVAAFPIPEVIRGINAFTLGVREVNPDAEVRVIWTNTWFGPPQEKEAAEALLAEGADVIAQHQDTTEPQKAAADAGAVSIGYDSDMSAFVGDTVLTSPVWNWGVKYVDIVREVMNGTYKSESYWGGLDDGVVDLAPLSPRVPDDIKKLIEERKELMKAGKWDVFCGPIKGANGKLVVAEGNCLTDGEMLSMDYFVEGVVGEAPNEAPEGLGEPSEKAGGKTAMMGEAVAEKKTEMKVGFVYVGPVGDLGWSYAHDQGRLALEELPYVETNYVELVAEGPDATRVIRDFAAKGYDMIFATSFGYMDSVIEVAQEYPDVLFEHATGYKTAPNVSIYDGRGYEGWYLAGITAGRMTKTNILGYVAPYPIPEVVRNMNAFTLGARSVNPDVEVRPVWIFSWFDPPKEREAAQALLDAGADVIARESDSPEPDKLAEENGVYAIGYNAISPDVAPDAVLTAPVWNWGVYYKQTVEAAHNGEWETHAYWGHMADGILDLAPFGKMVPQEVQDEVNAAKAKIISGELHPFTGPIKDNTGELRVKEGETMTDEQLLSFDWLVEGVKGEIPQ
ncbi:MAG: BMP family ABC transporter substrate-binding protein [Chloroflexi bacterium]|nr:MAG: BMP family ABC transporter substrate-binding protein [Chloroflexota bacterium]